MAVQKNAPARYISIQQAQQMGLLSGGKITQVYVYAFLNTVFSLHNIIYTQDTVIENSICTWFVYVSHICFVFVFFFTVSSRVSHEAAYSHIHSNSPPYKAKSNKFYEIAN